MSYRGPKVKLSRKLGVAITDKAARIMERRNTLPGQHGPKRRRSNSAYGIQLLEKQRLRFQYNISERKLRKYFKEAIRREGNTADELINILERRLDAVVVRAGFAPNIFAARQFVSHGHVTVNGKRVNIPSYMVKDEDVVAVKEKSKQHQGVLTSQGKVILPPYIELDRGALSAKIARNPERQEVPVICEVQSVVEWYSR